MYVFSCLGMVTVVRSQGVVTRSYSGNAANNVLTLAAGDKVTIITTSNTDWWYVESAVGSGYYPAKYLREEIPEPGLKNSDVLPAGWEKHLMDDGRCYYYHAATQQSQWTAPSAAAPLTPPLSPATPSTSRHHVMQSMSFDGIGGVSSTDRPPRRSISDGGVKLLKQAGGLPVERLPLTLQEEISRFSVKEYAVEHFNRHKKWGIFGRKYLSNEELSVHSKSKINTSLTKISDASLSKLALKLYSHLMHFMGDDADERASDAFHSLVEILTAVDEHTALVDEAYCQMIRQTSGNSCHTSLTHGWTALYAMCAIAAAPSRSICKVLIGHAAATRTQNTSIGAYSIAVHTLMCRAVQDVALVRRCSPRDAGLKDHLIDVSSYFVPAKVFGYPVENVLLREIHLENPDGIYPLKDEVLNSSSKLPNILTRCCEIIKESGSTRRGIFREAADIDAVRRVVSEIDAGDYSAFDRKLDVLIYCDVLKMWFRKMESPLIPYSLYDQCLQAGRSGNTEVAQSIIESMSPLYQHTLRYICMFIGNMATHSHKTNMEVSNLSLVFAPNLIRSPSNDPSVFAANADAEKRCLELLVAVCLK